MKERVGFVSNSSSSSFLIAFDPKYNSEDKLKEFLTRKFDIPKSPLSALTKLMVQFFSGKGEVYSSWDQFSDDHGWDSEDLKIKNLLDSGRIVKTLYAHNDGTALECFMFGVPDLDFEDGELIVRKIH